jgi:glc operon protein GlcG
MGMSSIKWYSLIKDEPALLHGLVASIDRLVIYGGGVPIKVADEVVGAVGVGGGAHGQDDEIARKAVEALPN